MDFRALDQAWNALPNAQIPGSTARWIGPLIDKGFEMYVSDLSQAAYGYIEHTGWMDTMQEVPDMLNSDGKFNPLWLAALNKASQDLAQAGRYSGPESSAERWASWIVFELSDPHRWVRAKLGM